MKIIIDKDSKEDMEMLKKIFIALGKDFKVIDERVKERKLDVKPEAILKAELKAEAEKPVAMEPRGGIV